MIKNSFIFLPGIKSITEKKIWKQGITDWGRFLDSEVKGISTKRKKFFDFMIRKAKLALVNEEVSYFNNLGPVESWRLYPYFKDETVFLDIETSGTKKESYLTILGTFNGFETKTMLGSNLNINRLSSELRKYHLIVTFNGSCFDIPFLNKKYPTLLPNIPHMDLRHVAAKLGLLGGLKQIEKIIGITRKNKIIEQLYGGDPLKLWRMYQASGDEYYLNLLIEYNEEDLVNLKFITDKLVAEMVDHYNNFLKT